MKMKTSNVVIPAKAGIQTGNCRFKWFSRFPTETFGNDDFHISKLIIVVTLLVTFTFPISAKVDLETPEDKILSKGFSAYMDGKDKVALDYFEEVIRINPRNRAAKKALQKVRIRLKKQEDKKESEAKKLASLKVKEGRTFLKTGDKITAIDSFHAALDAVPNYKYAEKELKAIKKQTSKVLKKKKFSLTSWAFARGTLAYLERDWAKAYRIWSERSAMEPQNMSLASAKARAENKFRVMMLAEKEEFLRRGAREFYRQGLYQESISSWEKIIAMKSEDQEALEGKARAERSILALKGKDQNKKTHDLLEEGLEYYASQNWYRARDTFNRLVQIDPDFKSAKEYLVKIKNKLATREYIPVASKDVPKERGWKENRPSNQGIARVNVPGSLENMEERTKELQSQLNRNPSDIRIQQELDKMKKMQKDESERIYKDGLIAYSQGNRMAAINKWKQVLVLNPDHKKAAAALRKARAEEERTTQERIQ